MASFVPNDPRGHLFIALLSLLVVVPPEAAAQEASSRTFWAATLVTANGDSLTGEVRRWRPDTRTPQSIQFRSASTDSVRTYRAAALSSVELTASSRRFVGRAVQVDQVPTDPRAATNYLKSGRPAKRPDTLLLESVVEGPLSLYVKQGRRDRYYVEDEGEIVELVERTRYSKTQDAVFTSRWYQQQLANRMEQCPEVQEDVGGTARKLRPLKTLVNQYNRCVTGASSFVAEDRSEWTTQYGLVGGMVGNKSFTSGTLITSETFIDDELTYDLTMGYRIGGWLRFRGGGGQGHWAIQTQLVYAREQGNGGGPSQPNSIARYEARLDHQALRLTAMPRYYFYGETWEPYLEGGLVFTYSIDVSTQLTVQYLSSGRSVNNSFLPDDYRGAALGTVLGGGVQYRSFSVGGRVGVHQGFSFNYAFWAFNRKGLALSMVLGYEF